MSKFTKSSCPSSRMSEMCLGVCVYECLRVGKLVYVRVYVYMYVYVCVYVYMSVSVSMSVGYMCMYMCVCVRVYAITCILE